MNKQHCEVNMLVLILAAFLVLVPQIAHSDCVDYGDYIHQVGSVDTGGTEEGITISGNIAYVVTRTYPTSALHIIDLSNPAAPVLRGSVNTYYAYNVAVSGGYHNGHSLLAASG